MSNLKILNSSVVKAQLRTDLPEFKPGTSVDVHYRIIEGDKERIQVFSGVVISCRNGNGNDASFTVLKNATAGIKVERVFPLHSPLISKIVLITPLQRGRRSKLYNLRDVKDPAKSVRTRKVKATTV
jgi:large subunit ribosomal protein L19